jgi:hypothetical protein
MNFLDIQESFYQLNQWRFDQIDLIRHQTRQWLQEMEDTRLAQEQHQSYSLAHHRLESERNSQKIHHTMHIRLYFLQIYAHWEGLFRSLLSIYIQSLNKADIPSAKIHSNLIAFYLSCEYGNKVEHSIDKRKGEALVEIYLKLIHQAFYLDVKYIEEDTKLPIPKNIIPLCDYCQVDISWIMEYAGQFERITQYRNDIAHGRGRIELSIQNLTETIELLDKCIPRLLQSISFTVQEEKYSTKK